MGLLERIRPFIMPSLIALVLACLILGLVAPGFYWALAVTGPLLLLGIHDVFDFFEPGQLLENKAGPTLQRSWDEASPKSFALS